MANRKRKRSERRRHHFSHNEDVIGEILSWLPTKSLLRFRSVCKSWKDLISHPCFVNKHLIRGPAVTRLQVLQRDYSDKELDLKENRKLDVPESCSSDMFSLDSGKTSAIVGSCNGLMCLRVSKEKGLYLLWNPCTGESKMLPELTCIPKYEFYGFGYDFATKDYKVIVGSGISLSKIVGRGISVSKTKLAMFALKTGSWRTVEGLDFISLRKNGCLLNGSLHWLGYTRDIKGYYSYKIVSFDLEKEHFQAVVSLPPPCYPRPRGIGSTRTSLFVFCKDYWTDEESPLTICTKEGDSWSKLEIPCVELRRHGIISVGSISILEEGEVLILPRNVRATKADPLLYNPKTHGFSSVFRTEGARKVQSVTCLETLLSFEAVYPGLLE